MELYLNMNALCRCLLQNTAATELFPPNVSSARLGSCVCVCGARTGYSPRPLWGYQGVTLQVQCHLEDSPCLQCLRCSFMCLFPISNTCLLTMKIKLANFLFRVSWEFTGFMSLHGGFYLQTRRRACPGVEHSLSFSRDDPEHNLSSGAEKCLVTAFLDIERY